MRAEVARADRSHAVRTAARGWRRAGAIDEPTLRAIVSAYPDDRVRLGRGFRILAGLAALVGGGALGALFGSLLEAVTSDLIFALGLAVVFAAATEVQTGRLRRAQAGAEYATAILAAAGAAFAWIAGFTSPSLAQVSAGAAIVCALAAWRWGYALFALLAAVFVLVASAHRVSGRAVWLALGLAALPLILRAARSPRWAPSHRRCFEAAGLVFLTGAYVATNLYSLDQRWIEGLGTGGDGAPGVWARSAAIAGSIVMPLALIVAGQRFRDRGLLAAGALFTAASLITLRHYHPIGPSWLVLVVGGAACLALAVALRRWLDAGAGRERYGFTAEPLFDESRIVETAQAAATLAAMSPGPRMAPDERFEGGGGRSGGGGATGGA